MLGTIEQILREAKGGPLMIREIAERTGISRNTAGKYVAIAEAAGIVKTDTYGVARRVWLVEQQGRTQK